MGFYKIRMYRRRRLWPSLYKDSQEFAQQERFSRDAPLEHHRTMLPALISENSLPYKVYLPQFVPLDSVPFVPEFPRNSGGGAVQKLRQKVVDSRETAPSGCSDDDEGAEKALFGDAMGDGDIYYSSSSGVSIGITFRAKGEEQDSSSGADIGTTFQTKIRSASESSGIEIMGGGLMRDTPDYGACPPDDASAVEGPGTQTVEEAKQRKRVDALMQKSIKLKTSQYKRCAIRLCCLIEMYTKEKEMKVEDRKLVRKACFRTCKVLNGKGKDYEIEAKVLKELEGDGTLERILYASEENEEKGPVEKKEKKAP